MGDQKRCRRETFDVADVRRSGRLVDQLEPFTCSADLQAVERPPPRRACSKSARMMTSPLRHGHVTGDANHTSTAKRVTPPRPEMWSARCFTAAVAEGSGLAPDRNGNQGRSMICSRAVQLATTRPFENLSWSIRPRGATRRGRCAGPAAVRLGDLSPPRRRGQSLSPTSSSTPGRDGALRPSTSGCHARARRDRPACRRSASP